MIVKMHERPKPTHRTHEKYQNFPAVDEPFIPDSREGVEVIAAGSTANHYRGAETPEETESLRRAIRVALRDLSMEEERGEEATRDH